MVNKGLPEAWKTGPILAEASYPEVIVARAVTDGQTLDLVLHAGAEPGPQRLGFARLVPGSSYKVQQTGATFTADAEGKAAIELVVSGRTPVEIVPVI